jgi:glycosyltransferase involved in cell wall biosynthesis
MRTVLHLIETTGLGGAEQVLLDLVRTLDRSRWRPVVVIPASGWLRDKLDEEGIEVVELPERGAFDMAWLARAVAVTRRVDAAVIHSHLFGSAVRAGIIARLCGIPAIGTIHGQGDFQPHERWKGFKLAIVKQGLRGLVFVSEPLRQSCLESMQLRPSMTQVISNGVDTTRFTPERKSNVRLELGISSDEFVVGCVGRLQPVKGTDTFIEAAARLKSNFPGCRFVVVGDGDADYTRQLVVLRDRLGLSNDLIFTGFRADVSEVMHAFDIYALTSRSEGFSLSTIEAMASGLPVVATRCGGPEQIVEDGATGFLVENGSPDAVANAIDRLRRDRDQRARFGTAARDVVMKRYTLEAQVRAYEALYDRVLTPRRRGKPVTDASLAS